MSQLRFSLGTLYNTTVTLTPLIPRDEQGKPSVNEKVYMDKIYLSYIDAGPMTIGQSTRRGTVQEREIRSDYGPPLGEIPIGTTLGSDRVYTETGRRQVFVRGRAEDTEITIHTDTPLNVRIAAVSQTGTIIPQV